MVGGHPGYGKSDRCRDGRDLEQAADPPNDKDEERWLMSCHHCGRARQSSAQAIKAVLKGDIHEGAVRARDAAAHIKAKLKGDVDGEQPASQSPSRTAGEGGSQGA